MEVKSVAVYKTIVVHIERESIVYSVTISDDVFDWFEEFIEVVNLESGEDVVCQDPIYDELVGLAKNEAENIDINP